MCATGHNPVDVSSGEGIISRQESCWAVSVVSGLLTVGAGQWIGEGRVQKMTAMFHCTRGIGSGSEWLPIPGPGYSLVVLRLVYCCGVGGSGRGSSGRVGDCRVGSVVVVGGQSHIGGRDLKVEEIGSDRLSPLSPSRRIIWRKTAAWVFIRLSALLRRRDDRKPASSVCWRSVHAGVEKCK